MGSNLVEMELAYRLLSLDEVESGLQSLSGWSVAEGMLTKEFSFETYLAGISFTVRVAEVADDLDHHPDIEIGYRRVRIRMNTHAVNGLSPYDLTLATQIDRLP